MIRLICFVLIILLTAIEGFSQEFRDQYEIRNVSISSIGSNNESVFITFENAIFPVDGDLPYYQIRVPVDEKYKSIETNIVEASYNGISSSKIQKHESLDLIKNEPIVKSFIVSEGKRFFLKVWIMPLRKNNAGGYEILKTFTIAASNKIKKNNSKALKSYSAHSVLRSGTWVKLKIYNDGVYKLTYDEIKNAGIANPANAAVFGNASGLLPMDNSTPVTDDLTENPIYMEKGTDGIFNSGDYILFYCQGPNKFRYDSLNAFYRHVKHCFSDYSNYFLTDLGSTVSMQTINSEPNLAPVITTFDEMAFHEEDIKNFIKSGRDWVGESFDVLTSRDFTFSFPNIVTSENVKIRTRTFARYSSPSSFSLSLNNLSGYSLTHSSVSLTSEYGTYASETTGTFSIPSSNSQVVINLAYSKPDALAEAWLDYITVNARRQLKMSGSQMKFRDAHSVGAGLLGAFEIQNATSTMKVWDITDPAKAASVNGSFNSGKYKFTVHTDSLREFIAFDGTSYLTPEITGIIENQDLHGQEIPDMVIVTYPGFKSYAEQLADLHTNYDHMNVLVATTEEVYNEFSSGTPDVSALKNFMKMFYDKSLSGNKKMSYLLLFGDGSYDNRTYNTQNTNYILTYQSSNSVKPTSSYVTDDYFAILGDDETIISGDLDLGVGRLPVKSNVEAKAVVDKIIHYATAKECYGDWRNKLCFIGDDEDGNQHMKDADNLSVYVDTLYPLFNIEKIYLDSYVQETTSGGDKYPDVNKAINNTLKKGALIVNYTGHGGELGLAHEEILDISMVNSWSNLDNMPLFMTATCEFSRFDDFERTSAGEFIILNPRGGGVGLFTTTRVVYASQNAVLNNNFYTCIFEKDSTGNKYRLGDVMRMTKNKSGSGVNTRNFTLLCDPALQLKNPLQNIVTTKINNSFISSTPDTLEALSKVSVEGYVESTAGGIDNSFDGILYVSVFDKADSVTTLDNDNYRPFSYKEQKSVIYRGRASVTNGVFKFSFLVPKDISYRIGYGKLSYYADNSEEAVQTTKDAGGYYRNIIIGGSSDSLINDDEGPEIILYMNSSNFVYGGITDENPVFIAELSDSSGINTVGNGIGHDITLISDGNQSELQVLNDFYESELNSYQKGKVEFPLSALSEGRHHLHLKVWDILNNSSEDDIEFIVARSSQLILDHVFNYPNPFTTSTSFYFDHNQPDADLDVLIQVFSISGKLIKTIDTHVFSSGFRSPPIDWDGRDDFGDRIGRGVYIYRVQVRTPQGNTVDKFEKIVILK